MVRCDIRTVQYDDRTVKCEKKKGTIEYDKITIKSDVGTGQCDNETVKYEKKNKLLKPPELAPSFSISSKPYRTVVEVNRVSQTTFSTLRGVNHSTTKGSLFETADPDPESDQDLMVMEADENRITDRDGSGSNPKRRRVLCGNRSRRNRFGIP
ncbi:hypothetical protein SO802_019991 [Lithocarpus litseifolius]|uniref:Uncharacterized protein n=1 Tax=Lithocarpus litseifolius TaxID=425828 RepID=A0AAW2CE84_9ROSI